MLHSNVHSASFVCVPFGLRFDYCHGVFPRTQYYEPVWSQTYSKAA